MDKQDRKLAISRYKERKSISGVYAVICTATGEVWVGTSRNLEAQKNSLWFSLRMKSSPFANLQQVWTTQGETDFRFEELDRLADDFSDLLRSDELKKRRALWAERLQAVTL
jgi:hypothetical protein